MDVVNECRDLGLIAGIITADNVVMRESDFTQTDELAKLVDVRRSQEFPPDRLKQAVRAMLKNGGFKPTGRNKPASEYLAQAAREERFPYINNLVDINNYFSLFSGLPISMLDSDIVGSSLILRKGLEGESYVFNSGGQVIDLKGLICSASADSEPLGNPVKDSMKAKLSSSTRNIIAVIYAPSDYFDRMRIEELGRQFAVKLTDYASADSTAVTVV